jgi:hypothetical protein
METIYQETKKHLVIDTKTLKKMVERCYPDPQQSYIELGQTLYSIRYEISPTIKISKDRWTNLDSLIELYRIDKESEKNGQMTLQQSYELSRKRKEQKEHDERVERNKALKVEAKNAQLIESALVLALPTLIFISSLIFGLRYAPIELLFSSVAATIIARILLKDSPTRLDFFSFQWQDVAILPVHAIVVMALTLISILLLLVAQLTTGADIVNPFIKFIFR